jgi:sulfur carrier protein ThiS
MAKFYTANCGLPPASTHDKLEIVTIVGGG